MTVTKLGLALVAGLALVLPASANTGSSPVPYPLLTRYQGMNVYGPYRGDHAICPRGVLHEQASFAHIVRGAVVAAMPAFARSLNVDGRDAVVRAVVADRSGFGARSGGCGARTWRRS